MVISVRHTSRGIASRRLILIIVRGNGIQRPVAVRLGAVSVATRSPGSSPRGVFMSRFVEDGSALTAFLPVMRGILFPSDFCVRMANDICTVNRQTEVVRRSRCKGSQFISAAVIPVTGDFRHDLIFSRNKRHTVRSSQSRRRDGGAYGGIFLFSVA